MSVSEVTIENISDKDIPVLRQILKLMLPFMEKKPILNIYSREALEADEQ